MVRCASGHQPLAMYGRTRKEHTYMTCDYGRTYGKVAADQIEGHGQWLSVREDALLPLVERFFAERIFGPMRLDKLARQLRAHQKTAPSRRRHAAAPRERGRRYRPPDRPADRGARTGIEPQLVAKRIEKLRRAKEAAEIELRALSPAPADSGPEDATALLARIPDLHALHHAPPSSSARSSRPSASRSPTTSSPRIEISATVTEADRRRPREREDLPEEVSSVAQRDIAGAGFEPATFGL